MVLDYSLRNKTFYDIFTTQNYSVPATNKHSDGLELKSTLYQQDNIQLKYPDGEILGGKTGYTDEAGQCLASYMIKNEERFISVTAGAHPANFRTTAAHVEDMLRIYSGITVTRK
jgi:D-alanyl-D-alanine carboxypeptidase (penicillin-binding protein 5/6)